MQSLQPISKIYFLPVEDNELITMLSAGSKAVTNAYQRFRGVFPKRSMMEIGLTDTFIMHAQMEYSSQGKDAFFEWSNNENETGCDFMVKVNQSQVGNKRVMLFQAKVAKTTEDGTYADFFYESAKTIGRVKVQDYQNILLAKYAKENGFEAYYVIYDVKEVWWVDVFALAEWFDKNDKAKMTNVNYLIETFKALAKTSILEARAMR
ncbi:uncharacterized protein CCOS01_06091 [Colletotrichum costaricense]|uniref:Uncharacterized protein n=1 Tax=Colletotrichum costaricense TaxID=1209916 RepID=A0AAI9Z2T5_9PEZI|nr:uncharacterized protein CCOS01_06091 [Colletotrichum costaricense]KAK1530988.1 hypothetical protein CCOS01_06091 [Colletotrichum costaricense]